VSASERNASHTSHRRSVSTAAVECPLGRETANQVAGALRQGRSVKLWEAAPRPNAALTRRSGEMNCSGAPPLAHSP